MEEKVDAILLQIVQWYLKTKKNFSYWWRVEAAYDWSKFWRFLDIPGEIWHKICRSCSWFVFMWDKYDWTDRTVLEVLKKQITTLHKSLMEHHHCVGWERDCKDMRTALKYLDYMLDPDVLTESLMDKCRQKYGELHMVIGDFKDEDGLPRYTAPCEFHRDKCITPEQEAHASKVHMRVYHYQEFLYLRYKRLFYRMLEERMSYWED